MTIRNSVKALIIHQEKLLVTKQYDHGGYFYILPGGGQEHGENLHETLERECIEEINVEVEIGKLVFVREYIGKNHEFDFDTNVHQIEYMFLCQVIDEFSKIENGTAPDPNQIGVEWIPISEILHYRMYPLSMRKFIIDFVSGKEVPVYLGDIN